MEETTKNCFHCGTEIPNEMIRCPFCFKDPDDPPEYTEEERGIDPYDY